MKKRTRQLLLLLPVLGLMLELGGPTAPVAMAQDVQRRDEGGGESGRIEERGGGREGRRRGFMRRGGGDGDNERGSGEGGGIRNGGGGEGGGRRGYMRRGEGDNERGGRNGDNRENQGNDRVPRSSGSGSSNDSGRNSDGNSDRRSGGSGSNLNMDEYVTRLMKERDKDGDMMLKGDEIRGLSGRAAQADTNKDGTITSDELKSTLAGNGPANGPATATTDGDSNGSANGDSQNGDRSGRGERRRGRERLGENEERARSSVGDAGALTPLRVYTALVAGGKDGKAAKEKEQQRTYRFSRGADRLPATGLPSWFKSRDANGDGQVEMSEYSRSWSDRMVSEFSRYDSDGDGIVTAKEATGK